MQRLLDQAAEILQDARDMAPAEAVGKFKEAIALLEAARPGSERDGLMALAHLRLAQLHRRLGKHSEAERVFMLGYSYARTSREERVRRFAEKLREELEGKSMGEA